MAQQQPPKRIREIRYVNNNIIQGFAYYSTQAQRSQTKLAIIAEIDTDGTVELGLLGAFRENPLVLRQLIHELGVFTDESVKKLIKVERVEMID